MFCIFDCAYLFSSLNFLLNIKISQLLIIDRTLQNVKQKMGARENDIFLNFTLDKLENALYNTQAFGGNAAIAQPVERILGKDEVASSNLASSSI